MEITHDDVKSILPGDIIQFNNAWNDITCVVVIEIKLNGDHSDIIGLRFDNIKTTPVFANYFTVSESDLHSDKYQLVTDVAIRTLVLGYCQDKLNSAKFQYDLWSNVVKSIKDLEVIHETGGY